MSVTVRFIFTSDHLVSFCTIFEKCPAEEQTINLLEVKLLDLNDRWDSLVAIYHEVMVSDDVAVTEKFKESATAKFERCANSYYTWKSRMLDLLELRKKDCEPLPQAPTNNEQQTANSHRIKVPPCDVQVFYGTVEEWPSFKDIFTAVFINNTEIDDSLRLYHLRNKTKKQAGAIVERYGLAGENFKLAWNALKLKYENRKILVDKQVDILLNIKEALVESSDEIQRIQTTINDCLALVSAQHVNVKEWDPITVHICASKLPEESLKLWEQSISTSRDLPTWEEMNNFLSSRFEVLERVSNTRSRNRKELQNSRNTINHQNKNKSSLMQYQFRTPNYLTDKNRQIDPRQCKMCEKPHILRSCPQFKVLSVQKRLEFVSKNKICENCISANHDASQCTSPYTCLICKRKHNTLLHCDKRVLNENASTSRGSRRTNVHFTQSQELKNESSSDNTEDETLQVQTYFTAKRSNTIFPTALIKIENEGEEFVARALLDFCSAGSFITERLQKRLNLSCANVRTNVSGMGGHLTNTSNKICIFTVVEKSSNFKIDVEAAILKRLTNLIPSYPLENPNIEGLMNLELADPNCFVPAQVDVVLGAEISCKLLVSNSQIKSIGPLTGFKTVFGWILSGAVNSVNTYSTWITQEDKEPINDLVKKFWETEEVSKERPQSEEDKFCLDFFDKTTIRLPTGRFMVRLPFKKEFPSKIGLGPSRFIALAQFRRMEGALSKNKDLEAKYNDVLLEYLRLGHMEKTSSLEIPRADSHLSFYLPHHSVVKPDAKSTKVRVVFNASKRTKSNFSLNDILHIGPTLQADLTMVILNWRLYQFVFNSDMEKMYRQIWVHPDDRPFQKILFRKSAQDPIEDFALKTITFGVNCAPYLAIKTIHTLANETSKSFPLASKILKAETYVDDVLSGGHTLAQAKEAQSQLISVLKSAGIPLKKWTANHPELLSKIPEEDKVDSNFLMFYDTSSTKMLGITWNALSDTFCYSITPIKPTTNATKRQILSKVATLFDPAGWLAPIIIQAKILLQQLWLEGSDWDTNVKPTSLQKWNKFLENLPDLEEIKIPRWLHFAPENKSTLHGFCDASENAYCAVIYVRSTDMSGRVSANLLVSKTKVAPLQKTSLPRLELCGAVLLSKLIKNVLKNINFEPKEITLWSDSSIVLAWLDKPPHVWKTYVANRVSEIRQNVSNATWRHVPSASNPADLGTRGCTPKELKVNALWWKGPEWLIQEPSHWPLNQIARILAPEAKTSESFLIQKKLPCPFTEMVRGTQHTTSNIKCLCRTVEHDLLTDFSSFPRALRVMAYVFRFIHRSLNKYRKSIKVPQGNITTNEIKFVNDRLIVISQIMYYPTEYNNLKSKTELPNKSPLLSLTPFFDTSETLRVKGRLKNSEDLTYDERHPKIIHPNSKLCELVVQYIHILLLHAEHQLMLLNVRRLYYIPLVKNKIKSCISRCKICTIYKKKVRSQIMGDLPAERVTFAPPFTHTGIDFAGPFQLKSSSLRKCPIMKGYVCVFVCFITKAIHLETCSDLTSECFIAAFTRFVSRRGYPKKVFSDNGRNFVGANRQLLKDYKAFIKLASQDVALKYQTQGMEWHFIPPSAPHFGGLWEAAVKSFKHHLKKVAQNHIFTFEEFTTLLTRIEAVLNSRPLSPISDDPSQVLPLTPGHFLRGSPMMQIPEPDKHNLPLINRWEKVKSLHHHFSSRWKAEYLRELQKRVKWKQIQKDIAVDDLVVIMDDSLPPVEWSLGRITEVHHGGDNHVRVVDIRTQNGSVSRPISKVVLLPKA